MNWIQHPLTLTGPLVSLQPLEPKHFDELIEASQHEIIWTFMPVNGCDQPKLRAALQEAISLREKEEQYPFVIIENATGKIIGSTRFLQITPEHKKLEIGWTWYLPGYWSKGYNEACKLLLLRYCFETLQTQRVQIVAAAKNVRSRKAITRIGAHFEGELRNYTFRNGEPRNTAMYSIIDTEWPAVKSNLQQLINERSPITYHLLTTEEAKAALAAIKRIGNISFGQHFNKLTPENAADMSTRLQQDGTWQDLLAKSKCFVAMKGNTMAGMAHFVPSGNAWDVFKPEWAYLRMVGVDPAYQGQGIARKLTQMCIDHARQTNEKTLTLHTSEFMDAARHIYESIGFTILKEIPERLGKKYWLYALEL